MPQYNIIHIIYIWRKMELQDFFNGFLKIQRKEIRINVITKDKSSEIHIGESIIKSSDCENLLDIKIDSKIHLAPATP